MSTILDAAELALAADSATGQPAHRRPAIS